jgi:hypothetical protein
MGQPFGRFGYSDNVRIPGFEITRGHFRINHPAADRFYFEHPTATWAPVTTTEMGQTVVMTGKGGSPNKLRTNLCSVGFELHFQHGFQFRLSSNTAPFLSWPKGSVGVGVETPEAEWISVSFRDNQPPLLLVFPDKKARVKVTGKSGDWYISTPRDFTSWVRVFAPTGVRAHRTGNAEELGALVQKIEAERTLWLSPPPALTGVKVQEDATSVTATWEFDRSGALLPMPIIMAPIGGYQIAVLSEVRRADLPTEHGPTALAAGKQLTVRFSTLRVPTGRALTLGEPTEPPIGTASPHDLPSVISLALSNLQASAHSTLRKTALDTTEAFLVDAAYETEPFTNQRLPYAPDGKGLDLAAAHALLMQSNISTSRATSEPNSLLTSLTWRRDWHTWGMAVADANLRRRAGSVLALAAAICPEPERRLDGAMLHASLAAERGLQIWMRRQKMITEEPKMIEPMESLRRDLFTAGPVRGGEGFGRSILSDLRIFGDHTCVLLEREGKRFLQWNAEGKGQFTFTIAAAYPLEFSSGVNVSERTEREAFGFTTVTGSAAGPGVTEIEIKGPEWAQPIPAWRPPPHYTEELK